MIHGARIAAADDGRIDVERWTTSGADIRVTLFRDGTAFERQTYNHVPRAELLHAIFQALPPRGVYIVQIEQPDSRKLPDVPRWT